MIRFHIGDHCKAIYFGVVVWSGRCFQLLVHRRWVRIGTDGFSKTGPSPLATHWTGRHFEILVRVLARMRFQLLGHFQLLIHRSWLRTGQECIFNEWWLRIVLAGSLKAFIFNYWSVVVGYALCVGPDALLTAGTGKCTNRRHQNPEFSKTQPTVCCNFHDSQ